MRAATRMAPRRKPSLTLSELLIMEEEFMNIDQRQPELTIEDALSLLANMASSATETYSSRYSCFPAKWQLIRDKLERLRSGLSLHAAAAGTGSLCENDYSNFELRRFVQLSSSTLKDLQRVSCSCRDGGSLYTGGKLLLRSDLDLIIAGLDIHLRHLADINLSAPSLLVLPQPTSLAVVPARPRRGAALEELRFYWNDLLLRLKIGDSDVMVHAMQTVREFLDGDELCGRIDAFVVEDDVEFLVSVLESPECGVELREDAAGALAAIAGGSDALRGDLVRAGAVAALLLVMENKAGASGAAKEKAAQALRCITQNSDNLWVVASEGGVSVLLDACADPGSSAEVVSSALAVLRNLGKVEAINQFMAEMKAASVLTRVLQTRDSEVCKIQSVELLLQLTAAKVDNCDGGDVVSEAANSGWIESLIRLLDPARPLSSKARLAALAGLSLVCTSSSCYDYSSSSRYIPTRIMITNALTGPSFLSWLGFHLTNGDIAVEEEAVKLVLDLSRLSGEHRRAVGRAGLIGETVRFLGAKSALVREIAAQAISNTLAEQSNCAMFIKSDQQCCLLTESLMAAQLLDNPINCSGGSRESCKARTFALSALMSLASTASGRKKMKACENLENRLEKLAESGDLDAKKVMRKISSNSRANRLLKRPFTIVARFISSI